MDFMGGCTLIIDPFGDVRYAIFKRLDSENRQKRQLAAIKGPLRKYWTQHRGKFVRQKGTFRMMHGVGEESE